MKIVRNEISFNIVKDYCCGGWTIIKYEDIGTGKLLRGSIHVPQEMIEDMINCLKRCKDEIS